MDTSLKAAREFLFNDRAWASTGKTLDGRVNSCLLRALRDMAGEAPEALIPEPFHTRVRTSINGAGETVNATLLKTDDMKVLQFAIDTSSTWVPTVDGTWDGIMHLEITDPDGRIRRRPTREWWVDETTTPDTYYVSIDKPWYDTGATALQFRIHQPEFFLPKNTIKVLDPLRLFDESEQQVGQISGGSARRSSIPDINQRVESQPNTFWRDRFFQMPTPSTAPTVLSVKQNANVPDNKGSSFGVYLPWLGPVQEGQFEFCYTYAWCRVEQEWGESVAHLSDPVWESAPSPISDVFDHKVEMDRDTDGTLHGRAIVVQCSNIEEMLDFMGDPLGVRVDAATYPPADVPLRYGRSGIKIRLYVRRKKVYDTHGPISTSSTLIQRTHRMNRTEPDGKFYLLTMLDPLDREPTLAAMTVPDYRVSAFAWQGAPTNVVVGQNNLLPDPSRQLRKSAGYYSYRLWPVPDQDYDLDISVLRQPTELVNDNDPVPIAEDGFAAFLELALAYMCRLDGVDAGGEAKHRKIYTQLIRRFKSLHGDNSGVVENQSWGRITERTHYGTFQEG
jgi:hypothetical protein